MMRIANLSGVSKPGDDELFYIYIYGLLPVKLLTCSQSPARVCVCTREGGSI